MSFDRFDICAAYWLFGYLYHGGQFTKEYAYLGRVRACGFKPGPLFGVHSLSDNARQIFEKLESTTPPIHQ
jgi:hypothetical protein